jgi:hypothetical protein
MEFWPYLPNTAKKGGILTEYGQNYPNTAKIVALFSGIRPILTKYGQKR